MFLTLFLTHENLLLHPFRADDLARYDQLAEQIFKILSDDETLRFIPEKRLLSIAAAKQWLNGAIINLHSGRNSIHFITCKNTGALVGIVDIIPPAVAKEYYHWHHYPFFIEFYLDANEKDKAIMTSLLPLIVADLKQQGIQHIAAVINRKNIAARKVLGKSGFIYAAAFDPIQDFYELTYSD